MTWATRRVHAAGRIRRRTAGALCLLCAAAAALLSPRPASSAAAAQPGVAYLSPAEFVLQANDSAGAAAGSAAYLESPDLVVSYPEDATVYMCGNVTAYEARYVHACTRPHQPGPCRAAQRNDTRAGRSHRARARTRRCCLSASRGSSLWASWTGCCLRCRRARAPPSPPVWLAAAAISRPQRVGLRPRPLPVRPRRAAQAVAGPRRAAQAAYCSVAFGSAYYECAGYQSATLQLWARALALSRPPAARSPTRSLARPPACIACTRARADDARPDIPVRLRYRHLARAARGTPAPPHARRRRRRRPSSARARPPPPGVQLPAGEGSRVLARPVLRDAAAGAPPRVRRVAPAPYRA